MNASLQEKLSSGANVAPVLHSLLAGLQRKLGRPPRTLEIGTAQSRALLDAVTGEIAVEPLDGDSSAVPDLVLIHCELAFEPFVQALYAIRDRLRPDSVLCGPGLERPAPALRMVLEHFIRDYRVEAGFWVANTQGIEHLKLWPRYEDVAHLVRQLHTEQAQASSLGDSVPQNAKLSRETVTWAFRLFLDREPQNAEEVDDKQRRLAGVASLRREIVESSEFRRRNSSLFWLSCTGNEAPITVQVDTSGADRQALLAQVQAAWEHLGATEPHWSVLTAEQFKQSRIAENEEAFYLTGKPNVETLWHTLARNGVDPTGYKTCLEYGCGLGRVTRWLAERFTTVYGYDISRAHLEGAAHYLARRSIGNVEWRHVSGPDDLDVLPRVDVVYSVIVLQHNPPPVMAMIVEALLAALNPGGVAYFQVPTYQRGYRFVCSEYLAASPARRGMEMHVLPQHVVFDLANRADAQVLEVFEDTWTGIADGGRSNTFVIQKNGTKAMATRR